MSKKSKRRAARTVLFIILAAVLFSFLIFALYKIDFMDVLEFIPSVFEKKEETNVPDHSEKIKEIMELLGAENAEYETVNSDAKTVISMLSAVEPVENYYHTYTVKYTFGDELLFKNLYVTKNENEWKILVRDSNSGLKTIRFDGKQYSVKDEITGDEKIFSKDSGLSLETQSYLPPLSEIKSLLSEYESAEAASDISDCKIELLRSQNANIVSLSFKYNGTGQTEEYAIHLDYGVIISARSMIDGKVYYEATTSSFDPNTTIRP